uniref:Retrovirus-related Pol polyprotein from transposon TNT 1-94 n=1 Tax=Tanacetum cinerariifolium TaxID=118510 RepID=A0A6L2J3T6_TANCI|nr:retrovirus-related Pol polyprotein from transposon TNT 1-94 [Tanacetum cinerariifolium]
MHWFVADCIMDSGASFHATYCKEELERLKVRSGKVRLADDKTLDIASVEDVVFKTSFGFEDQQWKVTKGSLMVALGNKCERLYMVEVQPEGIGAIIDASKGNVTDVHKKDMALHLLHQSKDHATLILLSKTAAGVAFGVAKRLSQTFRAESMRLRAEALKVLWANSVSITYLIYRILYVSIGLHILEEEWREKDTSLTHLKVFGCDSFVKVKDVCEEAMKCTFIDTGSDEVRYSF